jgi:hypothetical protein
MATMSFGAVVLSLVLAAGFPSLDAMQQRQLASAADQSPRLDEGALYPLLRNVMQWDEPLREQGTRVPDYAAIEAKPEEYRGELFTIEGRFVESKPKTMPLSRSGPWGSELTKWVIRVSGEPDPRGVIVLFADPEGDLVEPGDETPVRTVGRFFKVWRPFISEDPPQRKSWLVFVARDAKVTGSGGSFGGGANSTEIVGVAVALAVILFGYVLWRARRVQATTRGGSGSGFSLFTGRAIEPRRVSHHEPADEAEPDADEADDPALPDQSDQALAELSRRHGEAETIESAQAADGDEPQPNDELGR